MSSLSKPNWLFVLALGTTWRRESCQKGQKLRFLASSGPWSSARVTLRMGFWPVDLPENALRYKHTSFEVENLGL